MTLNRAKREAGFPVFVQDKNGLALMPTNQKRSMFASEHFGKNELINKGLAFFVCFVFFP